MGEGNVQHKCLENLPFPGKFREDVKRAHHLQPVGKLQHCDARIPGVRDNQFLVVVSLKFRVLRLDGGNLVQPVDDCQQVIAEDGDDFLWSGDSLPESGFLHALCKEINGVVHILESHRLMDEHGCDAFCREAYLVRGNLCDIGGMPDEWLAVASGMSFKGMAGNGICISDKLLSAVI